MKRGIPLMIFTCLVITSCVRSLYPITENDDDLVFKKELLGRWTDKDSVQYIVDTLSGSGGKTYKVTIVDSKKEPGAREFSDTSHFIVTLAQIKKRLFFDCTADADEFANKNIGESTAAALLETHFVVPVISIQQNSIAVAPINQSELTCLLEQEKFQLRNELLEGDNLLITEKPLALQQKLRELEIFPGVFATSTLFRAKN